MAARNFADIYVHLKAQGPQVQGFSGTPQIKELISTYFLCFIHKYLMIDGEFKAWANGTWNTIHISVFLYT